MLRFTPAPSALMTAFLVASAPVPLVDRLEHAHDASARPYTLGKVLLRLWCTHRRGTPAGQSPWLGFPDVLRRYYGAMNVGAAAAHAVRRGARRLRDFGLY